MDIDWIHCNKCSRMKATNDISLYLSQCQHIFCKDCLQNICPICGINMKVMKIDSSMPANMKTIFEDFEKGLERLNKTMKFQWMQRSHLEAAKLSTLARYAEIQKETKRMKKGLILLTENANKEKYKLMKVKEHFALLMRYRSHGASGSGTPQFRGNVTPQFRTSGSTPGNVINTPLNFSAFKDKSNLDSTIISNITLGSMDDSLMAGNEACNMQDIFLSQQTSFGKCDADRSADSGFASGGIRPKGSGMSAYNQLFEKRMI